MLLLDTCTLLWLVGEPKKLSETAREAIRTHRGRLFVSAISAFEIGVKHHKGKLDLPIEPELWFEAALRFHGLREVAVNGRIAAQSTALPLHHADPFDRLVIATAMGNGLVVVTPDPLFALYSENEVLW